MSNLTEGLGLQNAESISEQELLDAIRARVGHMLDHEPDLLMSYLYRLDVLEVDLKAVLNKNSGIAPVEGLSKLILERQKLRQATKDKYKQGPIDGHEW